MWSVTCLPIHDGIDAHQSVLMVMWPGGNGWLVTINTAPLVFIIIFRKCISPEVEHSLIDSIPLLCSRNVLLHLNTVTTGGNVHTHTHKEDTFEMGTMKLSLKERIARVSRTTNTMKAAFSKSVGCTCKSKTTWCHWNTTVLISYYSNIIKGPNAITKPINLTISNLTKQYNNTHNVNRTSNIVS